MENEKFMDWVDHREDRLDPEDVDDIELPGPWELVLNCDNYIVERHVPDVVDEMLAEGFEPNYIDYINFAIRERKHEPFTDELMARLAIIDEVQDNYIELLREHEEYVRG